MIFLRLNHEYNFVSETDLAGAYPPLYLILFACYVGFERKVEEKPIREKFVTAYITIFWHPLFIAVGLQIIHLLLDVK